MTNKAAPTQTRVFVRFPMYPKHKTQKPFPPTEHGGTTSSQDRRNGWQQFENLAFKNFHSLGTSHKPMDSIKELISTKTNEERREHLKVTTPLSEYIHNIKNMPDIVMEVMHGIHLPFNWLDDYGIFFDIVRKQYRNKGYWLDYLINNNYELKFELQNTNKKYYEPLARISQAYYVLAQETYLKNQRIENYAVTPAMMLTFIEFEECYSIFQNSELMGNTTVLRKTQHCRDIVSACNYLTDASKLTFKEHDTKDIGLSSNKILINEAALLARKSAISGIASCLNG